MTTNDLSADTVARIFELDAMLDWFRDLARRPSAHELEVASGRLGRNSAPALMISLACDGLLTSEAAAYAVPMAWSVVEFPNRALDEEDWRYLFELAGYTDDGRPGTRPVESVNLYRGAVPDHRAGWSWTDDRPLAEWFAARLFNHGEGRVWSARVEPWRLYARISDQRPGESEYVVDTSGLTILEAAR